jgi:hypothetical protein
MTEQDIMEEISKGYLELIANRKGYFNCISRDYGTDLTIRRAKINSARKRYLTTGKAIDIQVKAVSEKYISGFTDPEEDYVKYSLEVKNYNDLIDRANEAGSLIPLILAVFVMPDDKSLWLQVNLEDLIVRKCAFWYQIPTGAIHSSNKKTVTIDVPKTNKITLDFYDVIFATLD